MDVIIIGGGAAGLFAALLAKNKKMNVTLLEKNEVFGKKLSLTGNGRCNYTNLDIDEKCYFSDDPDKVNKILNEFTPDDTIKMFKSFGIEPYFNGSYVYPMMRNASEFTDIIINALNNSGLKIKTNQDVQSVEFNAETGKFSVNVSGYSYTADKVLVTTGGLAMPKTGSTGAGYDIAKSFGHNIIPQQSALCGFYFYDMSLKSLAGLRINAAVYTDDGLYDKGEVQFTQNAISGIPVMNISGYINETSSFYLDLMPDFSEDETFEFFKKRREILADQPSKTFFDGLFAKNLGRLLLNNTDKSTLIKDLSDEDIMRLSEITNRFPILIKDKKDYDDAQVTRGGVPLCEVSDYLESGYQKGLFFAGEVLNTDGRCGGYNLQWAFASANRAIKGIII